LIDVDGHHFPNLVLMKLSSFHKAKGDQVEWWKDDVAMYDVVYMAKVFSEVYSPDVPEPKNAKEIIKGGSGYAIWLEGEKEVYHPDKDPPSQTKSSISTRTTACTRNTRAGVSLSKSRPLMVS